MSEILDTLPEQPDPSTDDGLVRCPFCTHGTITVERAGRLIRRACRDCKGTPGRLLPEVPVLDYCQGTWPCCWEGRT